jgi:hypothetical protein
LKVNRRALRLSVFGKFAVKTPLILRTASERGAEPSVEAAPVGAASSAPTSRPRLSAKRRAWP